MKRAVTTTLVVAGIAAPVVAFFTGHAPPYYRALSVFITPTLGLISLAIVRALPRRPMVLLVSSIVSIMVAITLLAVYFQELQDWTVANPAHPTVRYQLGRQGDSNLTPYGKTIADRYPNETPAQWLQKTGYSEDYVARIWTRESRAATGQRMLLIYVLAAVLWMAGNELLKQTDS
jgi:hypothetical protein